MALKLLSILFFMGKKLFFLIVTVLLLSLQAFGEEGRLFSKIGIQSIKDKKKPLIVASRG